MKRFCRPLAVSLFLLVLFSAGAYADTLTFCGEFTKNCMSSGGCAGLCDKWVKVCRDGVKVGEYEIFPLYDYYHNTGDEPDQCADGYYMDYGYMFWIWNGKVQVTTYYTAYVWDLGDRDEYAYVRYWGMGIKPGTLIAPDKGPCAYCDGDNPAWSCYSNPGGGVLTASAGKFCSDGAGKTPINMQINGSSSLTFIPCDCSSGDCCDGCYYITAPDPPGGPVDDYYWDGTDTCPGTSQCKVDDYKCDGTDEDYIVQAIVKKTCGADYREGVCTAATQTCIGGECSGGDCCDTTECLFEPAGTKCFDSGFGACDWAAVGACETSATKTKTIKKCTGSSASCPAASETVTDTCTRITDGVSCDTCKQCSAGICAWMAGGTTDDGDCCTGSGFDADKPADCSHYTGNCTQPVSPGKCIYNYGCTGDNCVGGAGGGWECYGDSQDSGCSTCSDCDADGGCDASDLTPGCCGDGTMEAGAGEQCDGADLGGEDCVTQGFVTGTLACAGDCTFDTSNCTMCGNGAIDAGEDCDGALPVGETCQTQGFDDGVLECTGNCVFDTSNCITLESGDVFNISLLQMLHGSPPMPARTFAANEAIEIKVTVQNKAETQNATVELSILDAVTNAVLDTYTSDPAEITEGGDNEFSFPVGLSDARVEAKKSYTVKAYVQPGLTPSGKNESVLANNTRRESMSVVEPAAGIGVPEMPLVFVLLAALAVLAVLLREGR